MNLLFTQIITIVFNGRICCVVDSHLVKICLRDEPDCKLCCIAQGTSSHLSTHAHLCAKSKGRFMANKQSAHKKCSQSQAISFHWLSCEQFSSLELYMTTNITHYSYNAYYVGTIIYLYTTGENSPINPMIQSKYYAY